MLYVLSVLIFPQATSRFNGSVFYFVAPTLCIAVLFLTSNMLVNKLIDFIALGLLTVVWVVGKLGVSSVIYPGVETIAASRR